LKGDWQKWQTKKINPNALVKPAIALRGKTVNFAATSANASPSFRLWKLAVPVTILNAVDLSGNFHKQ
jgi:hypothetical protein